jgi:hypothetical protein
MTMAQSRIAVLRQVPKWRRDALKKALEEGPRDLEGDPHFTTLAELEVYFTPAEICWLANRALYQEDYMRAYHKKRREQERLLRQQAPRTLAPPKPPKQDLVVRRRDLRSLIEETRLEVDEDLGPQGTFDDEAATQLDEAFARPHQNEGE